MMKKKNTHHRFHVSRFYAVYLAVTAVLILIIAVLMEIVKDRLAEYEATQPKYVAEEVFARYFEPLDYAHLLEDARYESGAVETDEIIAYLEEEIGDLALTYSRGFSNEENEIKYIVKAGQKQFAAIILALSDEVTEHGFRIYELSHMELYLNMEEYLAELQKPPEFEVTFDIPASYLLEVDGVPVSEDVIASTYIRTDLMRYYPPGITGIEYAVYTFTVLGALPEEVVVTGPDEMRAEVSFDESTYTYTSGLAYSQSLAEEYGDFVTEAIEGYAAYVQAVPDVTLGRISGYFDRGSDAYADVKAAGSSRWMVNVSTGGEYENVKVGEFYAYSPDVFSCRISFTQVLHLDGDDEDFRDDVDMYVFLHLTDDGYKIYEWYNA